MPHITHFFHGNGIRSSPAISAIRFISVPPVHGMKTILIIREMARFLEPRFWEKVNKSGEIPGHAPELGNCWVWTAATDKKGYGLFRLNGKIQRAHILSYVAECGDIEDDLTLDHLCLRTSCVRPSHLEKVSREENSRRRGETKDIDHVIVKKEWNPRVKPKFRRLHGFKRSLSDSLDDE